MHLSCCPQDHVDFFSNRTVVFNGDNYELQTQLLEWKALPSYTVEPPMVKSWSPIQGPAAHQR